MIKFHNMVLDGNEEDMLWAIFERECENEPDEFNLFERRKNVGDFALDLLKDAIGKEYKKMEGGVC